jgi:hypothetical protein
MRLVFSWQSLEKYSNIKFHENIIQWKPSCSMRRDGHMDRQTQRNYWLLFTILWTCLKIYVCIKPWVPTDSTGLLFFYIVLTVHLRIIWKRPGTHCTWGWVGPRAGLDRCGKSCLHQDSIPRPSSPWPVAIPTELPGPLYVYKQTENQQEKLPFSSSSIQQPKCADEVEILWTNAKFSSRDDMKGLYKD